MDKIVEWAEGNIGALNFLMTFFMSTDINISDVALITNKIEAYTTLRGTNLYILYSDLCDRDMEKVVRLFKNCPQDILEDACKLQDRFAKNLILSYISED